MDELTQVREEMVKYLALTFVTPYAPKERQEADLKFGLEHYSKMPTLELLEEYGQEKWKAGQDSMSY
ncbi:MAG TPA: hypothetical protein VFM18_18075 [Methanosarcina sp.]|nr:hypothetical protein [Methanosarcina sp.]